MSGISVGGGGGGAPAYAPEPRPDLNGVVRAALLSAQHLLRERFEKRVAWVDGHWEWRREPAGPGAPPLPAEARKKVADISRLFEILTNAQFRDREPLTKPSSAMLPRDGYPFDRPRLFSPAETPRDDDPTLMICSLVLLVLVGLWVSAYLLLDRRRIKQMVERVNGWFTKKAAAADGQAEAEQTPPRDDPPPPYFDGSAEPFLPPGGIAGATLTGDGDLPPPYSSCDAQPDCKAAASNDKRQSLMDGVGTAGAKSEIGAGAGSTVSEVCGAGKTDDEGRSKADSDKAVLRDSSLVVVV